MKPKTKYTCNPCSSIDMNNGLGSRVESALCRAMIGAPPIGAPPRSALRDRQGRVPGRHRAGRAG
eukprot:1015007-Prymnesium_polylepis.2